MASAIICDKCGFSSTKTTDFMHVRGHRLSSATEYNEATKDYMDVCVKCYNKIFNKEDIN